MNFEIIKMKLYYIIENHECWIKNSKFLMIDYMLINNSNIKNNKEDYHKILRNKNLWFYNLLYKYFLYPYSVNDLILYG